MDSGLIIGIIVFVIIVIISIVGSINESVKKTNLLKEIEVFDKELKSMKLKLNNALMNSQIGCMRVRNVKINLTKFQVLIKTRHL